LKQYNLHVMHHPVFEHWDKWLCKINKDPHLSKIYIDEYVRWNLFQQIVVLNLFHHYKVAEYVFYKAMLLIECMELFVGLTKKMLLAVLK
jgi:hypothetical protein